MDAAEDAEESSPHAEEPEPCIDAAASEAPESTAGAPAVPGSAAADPGAARQGPAEGASGAPESSPADATPAAPPKGSGLREGAPVASGAPARASSAAGEGPPATPEPLPGDARGDTWVGHREDRRAVGAPGVPRRAYCLSFHLISASGAELLAATGEDQGVRCMAYNLQYLKRVWVSFRVNWLRLHVRLRLRTDTAVQCLPARPLNWCTSSANAGARRAQVMRTTRTAARATSPAARP